MPRILVCLRNATSVDLGKVLIYSDIFQVLEVAWNFGPSKGAGACPGACVDSFTDETTISPGTRIRVFQESNNEDGTPCKARKSSRPAQVEETWLVYG